MAAYIRVDENILNKAHNIVHASNTKELLRNAGLNVTTITWEDNARYKNSCVGPCISDMSLLAKTKNDSKLMPVIRRPNFADVTYDIPINNFKLLDNKEIITL